MTLSLKRWETRQLWIGLSREAGGLRLGSGLLRSRARGPLYRLYPINNAREGRVSANAHVFLNEALLSGEFRNALLNAKKDGKTISDDLDRLGIGFSSASAKLAALDAIANIDWADLKILQDLLGRGSILRMG